MAVSSPESTPPVAPAAAVVVAGEDETRVLLRGLLRLHQYQVVGEAEGATPALDLVRRHRPRVLVVDVNLAEGSATELVDAAKRSHPALRAILVGPANRLGRTEGRLPADVVLQRPFRIRELADALRGEAPSATPV